MNEVDYTSLERGRTPHEAYKKAQQLREIRPYDYDLAAYEHELFMRYMTDRGGIAEGIVNPLLPIGYYGVKKFFQQNPALEKLGQGSLGTFGGLLDDPIIDPTDARRTSPASLESLGRGLLGTFRGYWEH